MSKTVLCIDDSRAVHAFLKDCLKDTGYTVTSAMNGEEALKLVQAKGGPTPFDLIFLDWEMPVKNGPDTFSDIKQMGVNTPVIMLTSKSNPEDIAKMLDAGVNEYIMKPFNQEILLEKIQFVLGDKA